MIIITIFLNKAYEEKVEYTSISRDKLPQPVQRKFQQNTESEKFNIYIDKKYTYVLYKPDHNTNEYMNTDLVLHKRNGIYVVNAVIENATDDRNVSYEKIIRFKKIPRKFIKLKEIDKR